MHWWCIRFIWAACGSLATCLICLAVALEFSIYLHVVSLCLWELVEVNITIINCLWDKVLITEKKKQKVCLCRILAVSCGYLDNTTWVCTVLYLSLTDLSPHLKLVSKSNLALNSLDWGLQKCSNVSHMTSKLNSLFVRFHETHWSIPKSPLHGINFA